MASDELTSGETDLLNEFAVLLADPSLWAVPAPEVEHRVVDVIRAEAAGSSTSTYHVYNWHSRARRWLTVAGAVAVGAAAATAITLVATRDSTPSPDSTIAMAGTDLAPGLVGSAQLTVVSSGVRISFALPGLPRRDGGEFYQVWLKNCDGTELVPAGSFHDLDGVVAWAGVSPVDFPMLTVTREAAAPPKDPAQGTSGEVVATGAIASCAA